MASRSIKIGDTVRITGKGAHRGQTGKVVDIVPTRSLPVSVRIGRATYFFSYTEVVKIS